MTIRGENVGYVGLSLIDRIGEFRTGFPYTVDIGETYTTYMIRAFNGDISGAEYRPLAGRYPRRFANSVANRLQTDILSIGKGG